ncbi:MAG: hypothetical protein NVSMB7_10960 [Chitinophagaceae bacterium]
MKIELIDFIELENYPSGTGIEFYDDKIYIVGDNSRDLLVMNKKWNKPSLINLIDTAEKKTSKSVRSELEAMTVLSVDKKPHLLIIGSCNTDKRNLALLLNLKSNAITWIDLIVFYDRIRASGITGMSIEGIAEVYDYLVLANRGNSENPDNNLIITKPDFWKNQEKTSLQNIIIDFENVTPAGKMGVSGLRYSDKHEDLFLTVSTEDEAGNGNIGKSYLAVIENLYRKIGREKGKIKVNHLIDLTEADKQFAGYKIESVCIQSQKDHSVKLQLVADNEQGKTFLFKVWLGWG